MHQIYITAIATTILAFLIWGWFIFYKPKNTKLKIIIALFLLQIPVSYLTLTYIRGPWGDWLTAQMNPFSTQFALLRFLEAPIIEELGKLWPLLIPFFWRKVTKKNAVKIGLVLGFGFGVGEIWTVAHLVTQNPAFSQYPWYMFGGFINERLIVAFLHGIIAGTGLYFIKNKGAWGILIAMLMHALLNSPILIANFDPLNFGQNAWAIIISIFTIVYLFASFPLLAYLSFGELKPGKYIFGQEVCPDCKKVYDKSFWSVNLGIKRYEKCPNCKKYHMVRLFGDKPWGNNNN